MATVASPDTTVPYHKQMATVASPDTTLPYHHKQMATVASPDTTVPYPHKQMATVASQVPLYLIIPSKWQLLKHYCTLSSQPNGNR